MRRKRCLPLSEHDDHLWNDRLRETVCFGRCLCATAPEPAWHQPRRQCVQGASCVRRPRCARRRLARRTRDCVSNFCVGTTCIAKKTNGQSCLAARECASDSCVDGACCNTACTGACLSCSVSGAVGTCTKITGLDDPDKVACPGTCDTGGTCKSKLGQACTQAPAGCISGSTCAPDGVCCVQTCTGVGTQCAGSCGGRADGTCAYPTILCGPAATCSGVNLVPQGSCSAGTCVLGIVGPCTSGTICSGNACKLSCGSDADCLPNRFCAAGTCHLRATMIGGGFRHTFVLLGGHHFAVLGRQLYRRPWQRHSDRLQPAYPRAQSHRGLCTFFGARRPHLRRDGRQHRPLPGR